MILLFDPSGCFSDGCLINSTLGSFMIFSAALYCLSLSALSISGLTLFFFASTNLCSRFEPWRISPGFVLPIGLSKAGYFLIGGVLVEERLSLILPNIFLVFGAYEITLGLN